MSRVSLPHHLALAIVAATAVLVAFLLSSCWQSQERSETVREGIEQGKRTYWVERKQVETKAQAVDPQAMAQFLAAAIKEAVPGADAFAAAVKAAVPSEESMVRAFKASAPPSKDWMQTAAELAGLGLLGTTGYQALKQRERNKHLPGKGA
jgi:hypothetical protein